jgi:DNA helicase-2/ATP-dependent DNA helicase PcrA
MTWDDRLLPEQKTAASHVSSHARLLAGPGTGKTYTLTRRICYLVQQQHVDPGDIYALTFTRNAAHELRQRVAKELGEDSPKPRISTLHSFALRQLVRNTARLNSLPLPLRIADDWEERNIILEDLKQILQLPGIGETRELLSDLSSDWQSLTADEACWEERFPHPRFIGALRDHRERYGYALRDELVYQLKRALEQVGQFDFEGPPRHLIVDEYQDLNRCDLAVIREIARRGAQVFAAGDDDQSIYGFRKAHPEGIRRFPTDYEGAHSLHLETCMRCDKRILELGRFIAEQDYEKKRIPKNMHPMEGREGGEVAILNFQHQNTEAQGVAAICKHLCTQRGLAPDDILILLRTDRNGAFSSVLREALTTTGIPVCTTAGSDPFEEKEGRMALATLRLLANSKDHLAWRTVLYLRDNNLGAVAFQKLYELSASQGIGFADAVLRITAEPSLIPRYGTAIQRDVQAIQLQLNTVAPPVPEGEEATTKSVMTTVEHVVKSSTAGVIQQRILNIFQDAQTASGATSIADLLRAVEVSSGDLEQEVEKGAVNILSMHKAKGLTAKAVIIVAAEDELLPGRAEGEHIGDEMRLLYVSLTRPKHHLYVTYCDERRGQQRHSGRTSGNSARSLTRFLRDGPITPQRGESFIEKLAYIESRLPPRTTGAVQIPTPQKTQSAA